jgi:multiple sugar transport system substrate-binding protein
MSAAHRSIALVATAGIAAALLAGCSSPSAPAAQKVDLASCSADGVTLSVSAPPTAKAALAVAVASFEAEHPGLTVQTKELAGSSYNEYAQQIIGDLASGVQVDVANIGHDQIRLFTDSYDVRPFDTTLLHDTYDSAFLPVGVVGGTQYAIPFQVSVPGLYRNLDALKAAGIDTTTPVKSLDDVAALAAAYTKATGKPALFVDGGVGLDDWFTQMLTQSLGGDYVIDGAPKFDNAAGDEAFSFYARGISEGWLSRGTSISIAGFSTQAAPMIMLSTGGVPIFTKQVAGAFDWDLQTFPASSDPKYAAGGNSWIALADDDCRAAFGQAFIADIVAADALLPTLKGYSYFPVDTSARQQLLADGSLDPRTRALYETSITLTPFGGWPGTSTSQVQRAISDMMDRIQGGADVKTELASTQKQIEGIVR